VAVPTGTTGIIAQADPSPATASAGLGPRPRVGTMFNRWLVAVPTVAGIAAYIVCRICITIRVWAY
jgi:hypothetical protein